MEGGRGPRDAKCGDGIEVRVLGSEHPSTLTSMVDLAHTLSDAGRLEEAEDLMVQVVEASKRVLGLEHSDTLISMGNLQEYT